MNIINIRKCKSAFTLIELLVVIAIISILAAILFPVFASAREHAREATCSSNMKQIGLAMMQYQQDYDERFPYRPDLKYPYDPTVPAAPPWGTGAYPASDPRCAWATIVLDPYVKSSGIWSCPSVSGTPMGNDVHVLEINPLNGVPARFWMWPFDHGLPIVQDDFWGKTDDQAIAGQDAVYQADKLKHITYPKGDATSVSDTQLVCDPYFPKIATVQPPSLRGISVHFGGRNNLYLDCHVKWVRDVRLTD